MAAPKGTWIALSSSRKVIHEILHHGRKVPGLPLAKTMQLRRVAEARLTSRISWTAIFMKAYGLVAQEHPELRRAYIPWPWPHLYEHPESACGLLIEREFRGEQVVLGARLRAPESRTLTFLDNELKELQAAPVESIGHFRKMLRFGRLPWLLRRFFFWQSLNVSGAKRAKRLGTFAISSLGNFGVEQCHPISPLTTYLTFGPVALSGEVDVKIIYDHRVMDGRTVARCLVDLEKTLNHALVAELEDSTAVEQPTIAFHRIAG